MEWLYVGIDVSKDSLDVVVRQNGQNGKAKQFSNTDKGISALAHWLPQRPAAEIWVCLEATGQYGERVSEQLHAQGMRVSVANPLAVKRFGGSNLVRNQTDAVDAGIIAEFCQTKRPRLWQPPTPLQKTLRALSRRLDDLQSLLLTEQNRLAASCQLDPLVKSSIEALITVLKAQIAAVKTQLKETLAADPELQRQKRLLMTIKGVGELTAVRFLAELGDLRQFESAKQIAAYLGLTPAWKTSGTSVRTRPRLSKQGPASVRHLLYMPAVVAKRFNPIIQAFCERLAAARKCDMSIIGAAMHKLAQLMYGVVHTGLPFDPNFLAKSHFAA